MLVVGGTVLLISIAAFFRVPLLPSIGAELRMTTGQLGLVTTVFAVGRLATDIPAGRLADRAPPMRSLGLAGAVLATGSLLMAGATTGGWVIGAAFVLGIASAMANTTGMTFFSTAAPTHQRGTAMASFSAALLGGQALGPALGGLVAGLADWRAAITTAAGLGLLVLVAGVVSHGSSVLARRAGRTSRAAAAPSAPAAREVARRTGRSQLVVLHAVPFASFFTLGAMPQTLVPIIGDARHGLSASTIGLALGVGGVCRFVGALAGGRISDRVSRKASLVPGMLLGAIGVGVLVLDWGVAGWVTAIVLMSLGSYGISVSATMLADLAGGSGVGRRLGTYRFVGDVGLIAGPAVTAALYEHVGPDLAVSGVALLLGLVGVLCALLLPETRWLDENAEVHG